MARNMLAFVGLFLFGFTGAARPAQECSESHECLANYNKFQGKIDALTAQLTNLSSVINNVNAVFAALKAHEESLEFQIANQPNPARLLYARGSVQPVVVPPLKSNDCFGDMLKECQRKTSEAQLLLDEEHLKVWHAQETLKDLTNSNTVLQKRVEELSAQVQAQ